MSATDELRALLDERGVEWSDSSDEAARYTGWNDSHCWFIEFPDGWTSWGMLSNSGTPARAIEATLGRGELERENTKLRELVRDMWRDGMCECDERGACAECEYHFPDRMRELGVEVVSE